MRKFFAEKWPEILILVVIIPGFVGLWWYGWGLNGRMIRQEVRIDGIVAALPDLRTRTAFESVYKPFKSAVIVSKPYMSGGVWYASAHLIDPSKGEVQTYLRAVDGVGDENLAWSVAGSVVSLDKGAISFDVMQDMAVELKVQEFAPSYIDADGSYILYKDAAELQPVLKEMGLAIQGTSSIKNADTWPNLIQAVREGAIQLPLERDPEKPVN